MAYGAKGSFAFRSAQSGTITFNNTTFGDPAPGAPKKGYYRLSGGQRFYAHANHLYSVAALTNSTGGVVERYRYDTYGKRTVLAPDGVTTRAASSYNQQVGFTGRYEDKETKLWYFRARYYSGSLGRFIGRNHYLGAIGWRYDSPTDDYSKVSLLDINKIIRGMNYVDGFNLYYGAVAMYQGMDPSGNPVTFGKKNNTVPDKDVQKAKDDWNKVKDSKNKDGTPTEAAKRCKKLDEETDTEVKVGPDKVGGGVNNYDPKTGDINYDPNDTSPYTEPKNNGLAKDPSSTLAHEASHAYDDKIGPKPVNDERSAGKVENNYRASQDLPIRDYNNAIPLSKNPNVYN